MLCTLDSIWSIGVNYDRHMIPVLTRYREIAVASGRDANFDSPCDLAVTIKQLGGSGSFAQAVKSRHRTSTTNGILKAEAVDQAARLLCAHDIVTAADLAEREADVKPGGIESVGKAAESVGGISLCSQVSMASSPTA